MDGPVHASGLAVIARIIFYFYFSCSCSCVLRPASCVLRSSVSSVSSVVLLRPAKCISVRYVCVYSFKKLHTIIGLLGSIYLFFGLSMDCKYVRMYVLHAICYML